MICPPEYTDGKFELYRMKDDMSKDFPEKKLEDQNMEIWYRELSVFDRMRYELGQGGTEVTVKLRIPVYKKIDSKCVCMIDGVQHQVYNATHVKDRFGFPETELTLIRPEKELEILCQKKT